MVEAGTAKDITEVLVNENYYVLYTSADELFSYAYLPLSDDYCIVLCFGRSAEQCAPGNPGHRRAGRINELFA